MKDALQIVVVAKPVDLKDPQRGPRMDRWVDVAECPLVSRQLPVGMHVPLTAQKKELGLGKLRVDTRQRDAVKREVPRGIPGVLPLVGHRDHVAVVEVLPGRVAAGQSFWRRLRAGGIALEPALNAVVVELFRPEHPRHRLSQHKRLIRRRGG